MLSGHPTVQMQSEEVKMDIAPELIKVDCTFYFKNDGAACTVRMGFPDEGQGAEEPYQGEDFVPKGPKLHGAFLSYISYVDGKKVPTQIVPTKDRQLYWHAKTVTFKPHSTSVIRDVYTLKPGAQMTSENGLYRQTYYVLHTGSSWHGPIEKAVITIAFKSGLLSKPIEMKAVSSLPDKDLQHLKWSDLPPGTILYEASAEPEVKGETLKFVKTNFRPQEKDDIHLYYNWKKLPSTQ